MSNNEKPTERTSATGKLYRLHANGRWYRPYNSLTEDEKQARRNAVRRYKSTKRGKLTAIKSAVRYSNHLAERLKAEKQDKTK